jgi:hypothetical protein
MINYDVPLNKRNTNANIKVNIFDDGKMRELGFTDSRKNTWYYLVYIIKERYFKVTFNLRINKQNTDDFKIDILDEDYLQPYDYQAGLRKYPKFKKYLQVHKKVQEIMKHLIDMGIIEGYNLGDYI